MADFGPWKSTHSTHLGLKPEVCSGLILSGFSLPRPEGRGLETAEVSISPEAKLTLLIAKALVSDSDSGAIKGFLSQERLDWAKFKKIITYHELSPSVYIFLKKYPELVPQEELKLLEQHFYSNVLHLNSLQQELMKILRSLQDNNIIALPLKGAYFLLDTDVYADKAYLRPMCDIDILVKKEDYPEAQSILERQGYQKELCGKKEEYWHNKNYHLAFTRKSQNSRHYMIEVHWDLDYPRSKSLLPQLWGRIKKIEIERKTVYLPSLEDMLFCLALHQRRFGKMLCLKSACDAAILLTRYKDKLDWDYMIEEAAKGKMRTTLYFVLAQTQALFNIQIPPALLKTLGVPEHKKKLIKNFIFRDTFSRDSDLKALYLKAHLLLYDNFKEPLKSIFNVPQEQFAKFYGLSPYAFKTNILYHLRWFYFIKGPIATAHKTAVNRIGGFCRRRK